MPGDSKALLKLNPLNPLNQLNQQIINPRKLVRQLTDQRDLREIHSHAQTTQKRTPLHPRLSPVQKNQADFDEIRTLAGEWIGVMKKD